MSYGLLMPWLNIIYQTSHLSFVLDIFTKCSENVCNMNVYIKFYKCELMQLNMAWGMRKGSPEKNIDTISCIE